MLINTRGTILEETLQTDDNMTFPIFCSLNNIVAYYLYKYISISDTRASLIFPIVKNILAQKPIFYNEKVHYKTRGESWLF